VRFVLKKRQSGQIEYGVIYGGIALLALFAGRFLPLLDLAPSCVFKAVTGVPCPTCGSTRSIVFLSHGDMLSAFYMNPLVALCAIIALVYFFYRIITLAFELPAMEVALTEREQDRLRVLAALFVGLNWLYLVVTP
jgi:hypothetical protein